MSPKVKAAARSRFVPPEPPLTPKAAATRQRLLRCACELFIQHGYDAVSLRDIAQRADVTKGAIYGHFRSKAQMLVEVIRWRLAEHESDLAFQRALEEGPNAVAAFVDLQARDIRLLEVDAAAAARHDTDVAAGMAELYEERAIAIREAVAEARDPAVLAFVVAALSHGVGTAEAIGMPVPTGQPWVDTVSTMLESAFPDHPTGDVEPTDS